MVPDRASVARKIINVYSRWRQNKDTDRLLEKNLKWVRNERCSSSNPNGRSRKDYMVIRKLDPHNGLSAYIMSTLVSIEYAIRKGMIPVVDMRSFPNTYLNEDEVGVLNAWELFFEQPCDVGLDDIDSEYLYVEDSLASGNYQKLGTKEIGFLTGSDHRIDYWRKICSRYIRINGQVKERYDRKRSELFAPDCRVVGVLGRGTDYLKLKPEGHAVQPDIDMLLDTAELKLKEMDCNKVFLATEDAEIYRRFSERFGDALIVNSVPDMEYHGGWLNESYDDCSDKAGLRDRIGVDYLINLLLLSDSDCYVGGITGGTAVVMLMEHSFKDIHIFDLGRY